MQDSFELVGTTIAGKYQIQQVVGEGGFGLVYRGHHLTFDQPIALKCLKVPAHFTGDARRMFIERFADEGKLLFRLSEHRSIVRVFDHAVLEVHGQHVPYLVLEWLEGSSLYDYLEQRTRQGAPPLTELEALRLLRDPIDGLALAHRLRVAHRDIKPENLFLVRTAAGTVTKLLDFGVAKLMEDADVATRYATATSSGFRAFSPQYGAPEQFYSKRFGETGPWTDVHAMGLLLTELVCSRPALDGNEFAEFYSKATDEARPTARARGANVSAGFEALCASALALESRDRFRSAQELLAAVDREIAALDASVTLVMPRPPRKRAAWIATGLGGAVAATTGLVLALGGTTAAAVKTVPLEPFAVVTLAADAGVDGPPAPAPDAAPPPTVAPDGAAFQIGDAVFVRKASDRFVRAKLEALRDGKATIAGGELSIDDISPAAGQLPSWSVGSIALLASTEGPSTFIARVTSVKARGLTLKYWTGHALRVVSYKDFETASGGLSAPVKVRGLWQAALGRTLAAHEPSTPVVVIHPLHPDPAPPVINPSSASTTAAARAAAKAGCEDYCVSKAGHQAGSEGFRQCLAGLSGCQ